MTAHKPVLLKEAVESLQLKEGSVVVDATLGGGGHSRAIARRIGKTGMLIAFDVDIQAINSFEEFPISNFQFPNKFQIPIYKFQNIILVNSSFTRLEDILQELGIEKVDAVLADLGYSSDQLEDEKVGMSFRNDAPLDMRLDKKAEISAKEVVNEYGEKELARIIKEYGEERFARKIAKSIVEERRIKSIETTGQLREIIKNSVPKKYQYGRIDPATRTFQAIRIEVNRELDNLERFIPQAIEMLRPGGRLAIISFHSLEDRIVKRQLKENAGGCICPPETQLEALQAKYLDSLNQGNAPDFDLESALRAGPQELSICQCGRVSQIKIITKKPVMASDAEVQENPRARSAKLRVCEKIKIKN